MKNKKKSFYFQDYTESEIKDFYKSKVTKVSLNRVTFLYFVFFSLMVIFSIKIIYLSLTQEKFFHSYAKKNIIEKSRRDIVDKNGSVLATNVILYNVGIRPSLLNEQEKKNLLIKLGVLFPNLNFSLEKSSLDNFDISFRLFGPNIPKQATSSVTSLKSTSLSKCFNIWNLSCSLFDADVTILK